MLKGSSRNIFYSDRLKHSPRGSGLSLALFYPAFTDRADRLINVNILTTEEARKLQSEEQKALGYRPPPGSLSAEAQSVVDKRDHEPVTKGSSRGPGMCSSPTPTTLEGN